MNSERYWRPQATFTPAERWSPGEAHGIDVLELSGRHGNATLAYKGGQVLSWIPKGHSEILWVSPLATFAGPAAIRGGIPVCWPWFGMHTTDNSQPQHGLVRTQRWEVIERDGEGVLRMRAPEPVLGGLAVALEVRVAETLTLSLISTNLGMHSATITEALHTYFRISGLKTIRVGGLDGRDYADNNDPDAVGKPYGPIKRQSGPVSFDERELTRLYAHSGECTLIDAGLGRLVRIKTEGSLTTVLWNPGAERARAIPDLPPGAHQEFVCIESGTAGPDAMTLSPGETHVLKVTYTVEAL